MRREWEPILLALGAFAMSTSLVQAAANLQGRVFADLNNNFVLDPGEPCVSAKIMLQPGAGGGGPMQNSEVECTGDGPGSYHFDALQPGDYSLMVLPGGDGLKGGQVSSTNFGSLLNLHVNIPEGVPFVIRDLPVHPVASTPPPQATHAIRGQVLRQAGDRRDPLPGVVVALKDTAGGLLNLTPADAQGRYSFDRLPGDAFLVMVTDAPGANDSVEPGSNAARVDSNSLRVSVTATAISDNNNFIRTGKIVSGELQKLGATGDSVAAATGRLSILRNDQAALDRDVTTIRRVLNDGSLFVTDYAGTALFRFGSGSATNLLDTTGRGRAEAIGLARLLRLETNRLGQSAVLAVRADNTRGIYRLDGSVPTLLNSPGDKAALDPAELAISDTGQVAYVARVNATGSSALVVRQTISGSSAQYREINLRNTTALGVSNLQSNGAGDLAFRVEFQAAGSQSAVVLRMRGAAPDPEIVGALGQSVFRAADVPSLASLTHLQRPRIGSDGTVVFQGGGDGFENFYLARPDNNGRPLALLPRSDWSADPATFDYDIDERGVLALRVESPSGPALFVIDRSGTPRPINLNRPDGRPRFRVQGRPLFAHDWLFFLATDLDSPDSRSDRNGQLPVGLYRVQVINGQPFRPPVPVAVIGDTVPRTSGARLLGVTQQPVLSENQIAFGILFQGGERFTGGVRFPIPTPGLVRISPLDGTLKDGELEIQEGASLPNADRLAGLRNLYYNTNGTLVFEGVLPGAGPLVDRTGLSRVQSQAVSSRSPALAQAGRTIVDPLLLTGADLRDGRKLEATLSPVVALPPDPQTFLFVAKFSRGTASGEGLFTLRIQDGVRQVQPVATTDDPSIPGWPGAVFRGFGDQSGYRLNPFSVSADGNVVFKALVEENGSRTFGVFQWQKSPASYRLLARSEGVEGKDTLERWAAGLSENAYYLTRSSQGASLVGRSSLGSSVIAQTGLAGFTDLGDLVVNGAGKLFFTGTSGAQSNLFRLDAPLRAGDRPQLVPFASRGMEVPQDTSKNRYPDLQLNGRFTLLPQLACGDLYFIAGMGKKNGGGEPTRGFFHLQPDGKTVETILIEGLRAGHGTAGVARIPKFPDEPCNRSLGTLSTAADGSSALLPTAFTTYSERDGWSIFRYRRGVFSLVASETQRLPDGGRLYLDAGSMLGLAPGYGPVFTINPDGEVAFLASDGQRWGVYRFSEPRSQPQ